MSSTVRPLDDYLKQDGPDELDKKIDRALGRVGALVRTLFIIGVIAFLGIFVLLPNWDQWGQYILFGAYLVFQLFFAIMFMIIQFVALFWFLGKPRIYWVMPGETGVTFADYKGNPEVLESARQVVTLVRGVKRFKQMGGQPIRGLLLEGPPGTGKSYLGQCIATEAGVPFGYLSAPSIMGMFWGMDMLRVMSLYSKARKLARKHGACILFIDEIDAIGKSRLGSGQGMGMGGMMMGGGAGSLNQLLNEMDPLPRDGWKDKLLRAFGMRKGRAEQPPILTIAATNIATVLDAALLRPGRFDRQLRVGAPSYDGRKEVFEYYLAKVKHLDLPIDQMVAETVSYTPVQIKHIVNESVVHAVWNGREAIDYDDFRWALETYEWGMRVPIIGMSEIDKRRLAYHEAGHAVAAVKLLKRHRVARATIEARHDIGAAALVAWKPTEEIHTMTKDELIAQIQISLASRASEQIFLGEEMSGASGDLASATSIAEQMVKLYGMNGSLMSVGGLLGANSMMGFGGGGPSREVDRILDQNFKRVKMLIEENRAGVVAVAEALIERHALMGDEVYELVANSESRTNGHSKNGHATVKPPADAPAFEIVSGGQQRVDPN